MLEHAISIREFLLKLWDDATVDDFDVLGCLQCTLADVETTGACCRETSPDHDFFWVFDMQVYML